MHFSSDFRRAQIPRWSSHYIDYDSLKTRLKLGKDVHEKLREQCIAAETFYGFELNRLIHFERQADSFLRNVEGAQQQLARPIRLHITDRAQQLLLFAHCNQEATLRILEKAKRAHNSDHHSETWKRTQELDFYSTSVVKEMLFSTEKSLKEPKNDSISQISPEHLELEHIVGSIVQTSPDGRAVETLERLRLVIEIAGIYIATLSCQAGLQVDHDAARVWNFHIIRYISRLDGLNSEDRATVFGRDLFGRTPLHHAAEYGLKDIVEALIGSTSSNHMLEISGGRAEEAAATRETAAELALYQAHYTTLDLILSAMTNMPAQSVTLKPQLPTRLARIAVLVGSISMLSRIIQELRVDVNKPDERGQTLLCAALSSFPEACPTLLDSGADANAVEQSSGKTALCLACAKGNITLVELFLKHGADPTAIDGCGWLPQEHAAYRGHFPIIRLLHEVTRDRTIRTIDAIPTRPLAETDRTTKSHIPWIHTDVANKGKTCVWISLGSNDATKSQKVVQLNEYSSSDRSASLHEEVLYSISVYPEDDPSLVYETSLPVLGSQVNKPWLFRTDSVADMKLVWKLRYTGSDGGAAEKVIASGIAMLGTLNAGISRHRESLVRDVTIPLQDPATLSHVGSVTFSFFWSTPHPPPEDLLGPHYWEFGNGVGGHRGSGKNSSDNKRLQIGENTIQSFLTAVEHGASFLEFDVQLTKDLIPVIYHDFLISETGTDSPMHMLSLEQFEYLSRAQAPPRSRESRSNSFASEDHRHLDALGERMAHTYFNKKNGFKANTRGSFIHEQTCTLEHLFLNIPKSVRMNIEIKYPMLFEADEWEMEPFAIKVELYVNTILDMVYKHAHGRTIVFSSFSPEICIALSTKQRAFPVFFLTKTAAPRGEVRSCCIQQAIHFAKSWGLPGFVVECTPLIRSPRLVQYAKSAGLTCTSFGMLNSDPECARIQFDAGIDGVISDSVRAIAQLSNKSSASEEGPIRIYP